MYQTHRGRSSNPLACDGDCLRTRGRPRVVRGRGGGSSGWIGSGFSMMVGSGYTSHPLCEGESLASPGRWTPKVSGVRTVETTGKVLQRLREEAWLLMKLATVRVEHPCPARAYFFGSSKKCLPCTTDKLCLCFTTDKPVSRTCFCSEFLNRWLSFSCTL